MAIDFPGVDEYIDCGSAATLDNLTAANISVAFWINFDTLADTAYDGLVNKVNNAAAAGWRLMFRDTGGTYVNTLEFHCAMDGTDGQWGGPAEMLGTTGTWMHIALTYNGSLTTNDPIMYKNGASQAVAEASTPTATPTDDSAQSVLIGAYSTDSPGLFLDGKMEDVRVFNRILSAQEVAVLAGGYRGPLGGEVGWWSMSDAQAITAWDGASLTVNTNYLPDMSGNANTGNPTGTPLGIASNCPHMPIWITNLCASAAQVYTQAVSGALTFVGTFGPTTISKVVAGAQTFAGTVNKAIDLAHGFTGAITFVGAVTKRTILHGFEGAITFAGTLTKRISKIVAGAISFVGELLRRRMVPSTITLDASISAGVVTDASVTADVALDSSAEAGVLLGRT